MNKVVRLDLTELMEFYQTEEAALKRKSLSTLLKMKEEMKNKKEKKAAKERAKDDDFAHIVIKYLTIYPLLSKYWSKDKIILSCAKVVNVSDITKELCIPVETGLEPKESLSYRTSEYLRTSVEHIRKFTRSGDELLYGDRKPCHVYRIANDYQTIKHGEIVLDLLYKTYPQLKEFHFEAYGLGSSSEVYEIYPNNHIYTPFEALMTKNVDAIIDRNRSYCRSYNCGIYTPKALEERLASEEVKHYFDVIRNL